MRAVFLVVTVLATATVGCIGADDAPDAGGANAPADGNDTSGDAGDAGDGTAPGTGAPDAIVPVALTLYVTPDGALSLTPASEGVWRNGANFFDPRWQAGQGSVHELQLSGGLAETFLVTAATLDLFMSSETPQQRAMDAFGFQGVVLWTGTEGALSPSQHVTGPATLAAGEVAHVTADVVLPAGGLVIEKGVAPSAIIGFTYEQNDAAPILVHTGGESATRLTFTVVPLPVAITGAAREETLAGEFTYNNFAAPHPDAAEHAKSFPLVLNATPSRVVVTIDGSATAGHQDLDLDVIAPNGDVVWGSHTPRADEALRLYETNFAKWGPGEYTVVVSNFATLKGGFTGTIQVWSS